MSSVFVEKVKKHTSEIQAAGVDFQKLAQTPYFSQYLQGFLTSLTAHRDRTAQLKLVFESPKKPAAPGCGSCGENCHEKGQGAAEDPETIKYSRLDGRTITINMSNSLIDSFVTTENKMFCTMGLLFHETAHLRYMDFRGEQAALKELEYCRLPYEKEFLEIETKLPYHFMEAVRFEPFVPIFKRLYGDLANVISDYHDEQLLLAHSGSLVRKSILTLREAQFSHAAAVEELAADKDGGMFAILLTMVMQYARYGRIFVYNEKEDPGKFYFRFLRFVKKELDAAIAARTTKEKYLAINALICRLWSFVNIDRPEASSREGQADIEKNKELEYEAEQEDMYYETGDEDEESMRSEVSEDADEAENQGNGVDDSDDEQGDDESDSGGSPAQNGKDSDQTSDMLNEMSKAFSGSGGDQFSEEPSDVLGGSDPSDSASDDPGTMDAPPAGDTDGGSDPSEIIQQALDRMEGNYIEEEAKERAVQEIYDDHLISIRNGNAISPHRGVQTDIIRRKSSGGDKQAYEEIVKKNIALIKKTEREITKIIQEETIALQRRRMMGRYIDTRNLYKVDQRYFMKKKNPDKVLDMAIAVLVDNSGSMKGRRIASAKEATVLVTEVLERLEIPSMIAAHNCQGWPQIYMYKYFEDTKQSKYSICQMEPNGDNRDGLAIEFVGQYLAERDEKDKLFIIISDGQPNASGYTGEPAKQDIRQIVRRLRQTQVKTIAFAIGDDKPQIHDIYGEAFVDISDYDKFPKIFAKMIEREIISRL